MMFLYEYYFLLLSYTTTTTTTKFNHSYIFCHSGLYNSFFSTFFKLQYSSLSHSLPCTPPVPLDSRSQNLSHNYPAQKSNKFAFLHLDKLLKDRKKSNKNCFLT